MAMLSTSSLSDVGIFKIIEQVSGKIEKIIAVNHEINLCPIKAPYVWMDNKGNFAQAVFIQYYGYCGINLAIDLDEFSSLEQMSEQEALDYLIESLVHEYCHYEQFKNNRRITKNGVEKRCREILKLITG